MSKKKEKNVVGVFRDRLDAEQAFDQLRAKAYTDSEIHVLMSDQTRSRYYAEGDHSEHPVGSHAVEGMAVGGAVGTAVGAALAAAAAVGTALVIPGLGLIIAGPLVAALAGAGAGGVAGGLVGALVGYGIPESNAKAYEAALREGGIVLGVVPRNDKDAREIKKLFEDLHADNITYA